MPGGDSERFKKFRREHARLHDPVSRQSSVEFVPLNKVKPSRPKAGEKRQQPEGKKEAQEGIANIIAEPTEIKCRLHLFQDQSFELKATAARRVELIWRAQSEAEWHRVAMDQQSGDSFNSTIGIDDGAYLFGYEVDGHTAPDARYALRLELYRNGVFSILKLARHTRMLSLHNSLENEQQVKIESNAKWLVPEAQLVIPAHQTVCAAVRLLPSAMTLGTNRGALFIISGAEGERDGQMISVEAQTDAAGAVPIFNFHPHDFGQVLQGTEEIAFVVKIQARGRGLLSGMITLAHSGEVADIQLDAAHDSVGFSHRFTIESLNLPCRDEGMVKVTLLTDSYLANYRLYKAEVPYRLIYLKKSLSVLNFKEVRQGMTGTLRLEVGRSDNQEIELEATFPSSLEPYVEYHHARAGVYIFRFNAQGLEPGTLFDEEVILTDHRSGLRAHLRLLAEVVSYRADDFQHSTGSRAQGLSR